MHHWIPPIFFLLKGTVINFSTFGHILPHCLWLRLVLHCLTVQQIIFWSSKIQRESADIFQCKSHPSASIFVSTAPVPFIPFCIHHYCLFLCQPHWSRLHNTGCILSISQESLQTDASTMQVDGCKWKSPSPANETQELSKWFNLLSHFCYSVVLFPCKCGIFYFIWIILAT